MNLGSKLLSSKNLNGMQNGKQIEKIEKIEKGIENPEDGHSPEESNRYLRFMTLKEDEKSNEKKRHVRDGLCGTNCI